MRPTFIPPAPSRHLPSSLDPEIDRLYQLPPDRFTAARNALAKAVGGEEGARIRALPKPTLPAWAVNSLHWRKKPARERVVRAAAALRRAQEALLTGKSADLREASAAHRDAVNDALKEIDGLLAHAGRQLSPAARFEVRRILEALPGDARPGRLAASIDAPGFEVFAGVDPRSLRAPPPRRSAGGRKARPRAVRAAQARGAEGEKKTREGEREREREREGERAIAKAAARARSARSEARRARSALAKAETRLEEEERKELRAREIHEQARERLEAAGREAARLREESDSADTALRNAEEDEERARTALRGSE